MDVPADFKFDVRIRARLLNKRTVTEAEVEKRLEALQDVQANSDIVTLSQPAIGSAESRPAPRPAMAISIERAPRSIPPAPLPVDDGWGDDEDDDDAVDEADDDDEDDKDDDAAAAVTEEKPKPVAAAPAVDPAPAPAVVAEDDEEDGPTAEGGASDDGEEE